MIPTTFSPETFKGNPGWTLRRRPGYWNEGSSSLSSAESSEVNNAQDKQTIETTTVVVSSTQKGGRRGNKTYTKAGGLGSKFDEASDDDNYPPGFKDRIAQLVIFFFN